MGALARGPFGGGTFIADKSAWERSRRREVAADWARALEGAQIAVCPVVTMELLYSTRSAAEFERLEGLLAGMLDVPITRPITDAAISAMRELARRRPLHHRLPLSDVLIAAAAQEFELGVLHYDRHYDRLAEVLTFESRWLAPAGSLD